MYPYIHIILPSYTVMALLGGFVALCYIFFRLEKFSVEFSTFLKLFFFCVLGGIVGSKLLFALTQLNWLFHNFSVENMILLIPQSGFVFYGGLFGVIFTLLLFTRKDRDLRNRIFRMAVPAMPLFHAFGRIGCFLTGCCYGKTLKKSLIICGIELTRIPVQLIEALAEFILFAVLIMLDRRKEKVDLLKVYLLSYAVIRFIDEFLRGDEIRGIYWSLSTAQWISVIIIGTYLIRSVKSKKAGTLE